MLTLNPFYSIENEKKKKEEKQIKYKSTPVNCKLNDDNLKRSEQTKHNNNNKINKCSGSHNMHQIDNVEQVGQFVS